MFPERPVVRFFVSFIVVLSLCFVAWGLGSLPSSASPSTPSCPIGVANRAVARENMLSQASTKLNWVTRENVDLCKGRRLGWSIETPSHWVAIPDVRPGWPEGAGFRSPSANSGVIITWMSALPTTELASLRSRGFHESECRVGGFTGTVFTRNGEGKLYKIYYVDRLGETYRLSLYAPASDGNSISHAVKSFSFVRSATSASNNQGNRDNVGNGEQWRALDNTAAGFSLSYPGVYEERLTAEGFELLEAGQVVLRGTLRAHSTTPGQSFRGYARALGKTTIPQAQELGKFAPYEIDGVTAYEAIWKLSDGNVYGPVVYVPLQSQQYGVLELTLVKGHELNTFFRVVNSLRCGNNVGRSDG